MNNNSNPSNRGNRDGSESPNPIPDEYNQWLRIKPIETEKKPESNLRPNAQPFKPRQVQQGQGNIQQDGFYNPSECMQQQGTDPQQVANATHGYDGGFGNQPYPMSNRSVSAGQTQQGHYHRHPAGNLPQGPIPTAPRRFSNPGHAPHPQGQNNVQRAPGTRNFTCWWWYTKGHCKFNDAQCAYSHRMTGKIGDGPTVRRL